MSITAAVVLAVVAPASSAAMFQSDRSQKTSGDQTNNRADVDLTAKIRKAIVNDKTLSTAANVTDQMDVLQSWLVRSDRGDRPCSKDDISNRRSSLSVSVGISDTRSAIVIWKNSWPNGIYA
jgi:hypothetical protein